MIAMPCVPCVVAAVVLRRSFVLGCGAMIVRGSIHRPRDRVMMGADSVVMLIVAMVHAATIYP